MTRTALPLLQVSNLIPLAKGQTAAPEGSKGVSFSVQGKAITVLQGPSGSGKSRLMRALADLDPSEGEISFGGSDKMAMPAPLWRQKVVYLAAESGWWGDHVIDHFFASTLPLAKSLLAAVGLPQDALDWDVARASTGEKQRLSLLRALTLPDPEDSRLYLLDEPTASLDPETTLKVEAMLRDLVENRPASSILMVSHLPEQADRLADHRLRMDDNGQVYQDQP